MRNILKEISIYSFGEIVGKGIGLLSIVFYTHLLSKEEVGLYGYMLVIVNFVSSFLLLGLDNAYVRYFFQHENTDMLKFLTSTIFLFLIVWSSFVLLIVLPNSSALSMAIFGCNSYNLTFRLAVLYSAVRVISSFINQVLRNQFKAKCFVFLNILNAIAGISFSVGLVGMTDLRVSGIFLGLILADIIVLPVRVVIIKGLINKKIDFSLLIELLKFGVPFLPTSVCYWALSSADRIMLERMTSLEHVGTYTAAIYISSISTIISSSVAQAWSPHAVKVYEEDKDTKKGYAMMFYTKFFKISILASISLIFFISMIGKELIEILFPATYKEAFYPSLFMFIAYACQMTTQVTASGISLKGKTYLFVFLALFVVLANIILNYFLIPKYTTNGAAISTMLSYFILTVIYGIISHALIGLPFNLLFIFVSIIIVIGISFASVLTFWIKLTIFLMVVVFIPRIRYKVKELIY